MNSFDVPSVLKLVTDLLAAEPQLATVLGPIVQDLKNLFSTKQALAAKKCDDPTICCEVDETIKHLVCSLSHAVKLRCCCQDK